MLNQLSMDMVQKQLDQVHKSKGELQTLFGTTIYKYVSPAKTSIIKLLLPDQRDTQAYIKNVHPRIERLYENLNYPKNIVKINGAPIKFSGGTYLMEMLDVGDSLKKMLTDTKKPFDHKTILNYSLQIALGLAQLQYGGINHRDVKPSNVIVVDGVMKIIDFDISRIVAADKTKTVTTTNQQFSKLYASPYRLIQAYQNEKQVDENTAFREDSYSLGLVILELICHCHSQLSKAFNRFIEFKEKISQKLFVEERKKLFEAIKAKKKQDDPIIKFLIYLTEHLLIFQSQLRIDLMAAYKFLKLIQIEKMDLQIAKEFILQQVKRSAYRRSITACEQHQKNYAYIYYPRRKVQPAETVRAKIATFCDSKLQLIVVDALKKVKTPVDVGKYKFSTGSRMVSTGEGCYMMGGEGINGDSMDINVMCKFSNLSLIQRARIPDNGRSSSGIAFSSQYNLIVLVGGFRKNSNIAMKIPAYDPSKNQWKTSAQVITQRVCPACCFSKKYLYIFGGMTTQQSQEIVNSTKIERIKTKFLRSEGVQCKTEEVKLANRDKGFDELMASCDALTVCIKNEQIMILGGANYILTEESKDGYIIDFKKGKFKEIQEPYYFTKTSFYTPGAWVDDNFLVPKPGASGVGELHIGKYDEFKGEIVFSEIDHKDYFQQLNLNI